MASTVVELLRRRFGGKSLPYDAEIEYLRSTGTQYIDTGIEATGDLSVECSFRVTDGNNKSISGGIDSATSSKIRTALVPSATVFYGYNTSNINTGATHNTKDFYYFKLDVVQGETTVNTTTKSFTPATFDCNCHYGIFARLSSTNEVTSKPSYFKWFKISRGGVLLRDYIPVRVGTTGYMYDKVSGQLFGNAGTGDFILGNDK